MGAINYKTSDFITMGVNTNELTREECENDFEVAFLDEVATGIIDNYSFDCFDVEIIPGHYEGFSVDIKLSFWMFDDYTEKAQAQKEVTKIKAMLKDLAGAGLVACFPSWCTTYRDYNGTLSEIDAAIKAMKKEVKDTPTYYQTQVMKHGGKVA